MRTADSNLTNNLTILDTTSLKNHKKVQVSYSASLYEKEALIKDLSPGPYG